MLDSGSALHQPGATELVSDQEALPAAIAVNEGYVTSEMAGSKDETMYGNHPDILL